MERNPIPSYKHYNREKLIDEKQFFFNTTNDFNRVLI
jgi:hypothetical protein